MGEVLEAVQFEQGAAVVRERSWGLCEACGGHAGIQTHHRLPRGMGGVSRAGLVVNLPSNLIRLCELMHRTIESQREWAVEMGYLVRRGDDPATIPVYLRTVNGSGWFLLHNDGAIEWQDLPTPPPCTERQRV